MELKGRWRRREGWRRGSWRTVAKQSGEEEIERGARGGWREGRGGN